MPIVDVQRRYRELGRLRMGRRRKVAGKTVPERLGTWRLTSPDRRLLVAAAELWGGDVEPWADAPTEGEQFEVVTETAELPVYVPPQDIDAAMWLELWSRGGVKRRCDGHTEVISGGSCICDIEGKRSCSVTTHLAVVLPAIPDVGVWRVRTSSWNAAAEIPSTVELLQRIHDEGALPLAILGIEARTKVQEGKTRHFVLPVLRFPSSIAAAEAAGIPILSQRRDALESGRPALPADARFDRDRAEWGEPIDVPTPDDDVASPVVDAGESEAGGRADVDVAPASLGGSDNPPERPPATTAEPRVGEMKTSRDVGEALPATPPDPWSAYNTANDAADDDSRATARRLAITKRWGWAPSESWPAERLLALVEVLSGLSS
jgi:recombination directionality factor gp3-like protein